MDALIGHLHQRNTLAVVHLEIILRQEVAQCYHLVLIFILRLGVEAIDTN